jgi:hypothetical protein
MEFNPNGCTRRTNLRYHLGEDCQQVSAMPQNSNDGSDRPKSITNVVGKHADQVMDGLFSEIEELLNADLQEKPEPARSNRNFPIANTLSEPEFTPDRLRENTHRSIARNTSPEPPALPEPTPPAPRRWPKLLAIGSTLLLVTSGVLWWLHSQGKINLAALAKGESPILLSNSADVQFSNYLRGSISKIESKTAATNGTPSANPPTTTTVSPSSPAATNLNATLTKIVPGNPPVVEFAIEGKIQQFKGGDQVGQSGWIITNVINTVDNEVILKRNGESRSLKVNDKL